MINETSKPKVTRTGDSADLHTIAQIFSKRLKVDKVVSASNVWGQTQDGYYMSIPATEAYKVSAV